MIELSFITLIVIAAFVSYPLTKDGINVKGMGLFGWSIWLSLVGVLLFVIYSWLELM